MFSEVFILSFAQWGFTDCVVNSEPRWKRPLRVSCEKEKMLVTYILLKLEIPSLYPNKTNVYWNQFTFIHLYVCLPSPARVAQW